MPELTREEKLKMIEKLPPHLQEFMYSEDTGAALLYFGKKYNLPDEKVHLLSKLASDVVLGIAPITALAQEINSKILSDPQMAMALSQELYNDLLAPVLAVPAPTVPVPTLPVVETKGQSSVQQNSISAPGRQDRYREPVAQMPPQAVPPQIVNLRKPAVPVPTLPVVETKGQSSVQQNSISAPRRPIMPPAPIIKPVPPITKPVPAAPAKPSFYFAPLPARPATPPATQPQKPIFKLPLIEASPHELLAPNAPVPNLPSVETKPQMPDVPKGQNPVQQKETSALGRQFILRPPGMPPAESPHDILDLRKDKGEF